MGHPRCLILAPHWLSKHATFLDLQLCAFSGSASFSFVRMGKLNVLSTLHEHLKLRETFLWRGGGSANKWPRRWLLWNTFSPVGSRKPPFCAYSRIRTSNSPSGLPLWAWKLPLKIQSMQWEYPLKTCAGGDDESRFFTNANSTMLRMWRINLSQLWQPARSSTVS